MSSCNVSIDNFSPENGELNVIEKYENLMQSTLGDDSLYTRSKETLFQLFDKLNITDGEKAQLASQNIMQLSMQMSSVAMQSAVAWAKEERDGNYQLALIKAQTENMLATVEKTKEEICVLREEEKLKCVTIEATMAASIRENGRASAYDPDDPCRPIALEDEGLKYYQTKQVQADSYRISADTYRKSGVVKIGVDPDDSILKGLDGTTHTSHGTAAGYTVQQTENAERQRIAYEDSKINHAANSSAAMIGQMLSAEVAPADADVQRWRDALDRLLTKHSTTSST